MLQSPAVGERLLAANYFLVNAKPEDLAELLAARSVETDFYVKLRLEQAIRMMAGNGAAVEMDAEQVSDDPPDADLLARATEWVGGVILHEMEGRLGRAALYASREVSEYAASKTKVEIEGLRNIFRGVSQLVAASKPPRPVEIDVAALISETATSLGGDISQIGPRPMLAIADKTLLGLAVANGLKNALEATAGVAEPHCVVVNWGATDRDYWISVLDKGVGISGSPKSKFKVGTTTKSGHSGFGLAVAKRVMKAMNGQVRLAPVPEGGALYELRWSHAS